MLDLLAEAARWTATRGYENWPARFPTRLIESSATAGELFVVELDGALVATVTLQWSDPMFWGADADDAGYVHRLAVRRTHSGGGIGHRVLDWADTRALERDCSCLRLDVVTSNAPLRGYYERVGFVYLRDLEGEFVRRDGTRRAWQTSLYERPCSPAAG